ncbi:MAG: alpha/beta hydrolase, partial [Eubacteriales bacterium]|nr:alpha/beta hydrolase [Eubacteriales bacterium]
MIHEKIEIQVPGSSYKGELYTYFLDNSLEIDPCRVRPLVLICPGGGYGMTSDREAEAVAVRFLAMGCHSAVLRYSVAPARYPEALLQLGSAVALLREKGEKWHIDRNRIAVLGFSAGGHLAASLGVFWDA